MAFSDAFESGAGVFQRQAAMQADMMLSLQQLSLRKREMDYIDAERRRRDAVRGRISTQYADNPIVQMFDGDPDLLMDFAYKSGALQRMFRTPEDVQRERVTDIMNFRTGKAGISQARSEIGKNRANTEYMFQEANRAKAQARQAEAAAGMTEDFRKMMANAGNAVQAEARTQDQQFQAVLGALQSTTGVTIGPNDWAKAEKLIRQSYAEFATQASANDIMRLGGQEGFQQMGMEYVLQQLASEFGAKPAEAVSVPEQLFGSAQPAEMGGLVGAAAKVVGPLGSALGAAGQVMSGAARFAVSPIIGGDASGYTRDVAGLGIGALAGDRSVGNAFAQLATPGSPEDKRAAFAKVLDYVMRVLPRQQPGVSQVDAERTRRQQAEAFGGR